jgi:predicted nucleic acid-binding protein
VIYYVERDPIWAPKVDARLKSLVAAGDTVAVSDAARLECLVGPLQLADASIQMDKLLALDSIHLAAAIEHGCGLFLTNDGQLSRCKAITVEVLA